jgi:protein involved in polysaccharide export with SLBB domain
MVAGGPLLAQAQTRNDIPGLGGQGIDVTGVPPLRMPGSTIPSIVNAPTDPRDVPGRTRADERSGRGAFDPRDIQDSRDGREPRVGPPPVAERNEFQDFVAQSLGRPLPMFGHNLFSGVPSTFAPIDRVPVTPDYVVGPGDEVLIRAWGQVDIDYRATIDRNGAINIPRVGNINIAGIKYQDLEGFLRTAIGRVFRNFDLNVTLGQLRSIQIFVVGQARRPGSYTVSSLSTLVNALFASGGPSARGSMRAIQLKRGDKVVTEFDFYDLLIKGDKSKDARLLPGDVIFIPPAKGLVAISGSVNEQAVYEIKEGTSLGAMLELAGGMTTTAEGQKATVERIANRKTRQVEEFALDQAGLARPLRDGDLVRIYALIPKFDNAITLRGNVARPGRFPWREGMRVRDMIPDRDALMTADYWQRQNNSAARLQGERQQRLIEDISQPSGLRKEERQTERQQALRTEVKFAIAEINWDYAVIERLNEQDLTTQLIPFNLGKAVLEGDPSNNLQLRPGDIVTIFSKNDITVPVAKQTQYVRLEGELVTPGIYQIQPGETLRQLVARIGGLSPNAYLYGAEFSRESTRALQQKRLDEAIDQMERDIQRSVVINAAGALSPEDVASAKVRAETQRELATRLRQMRASGRIVLELPRNGVTIKDMPDLVLEDGDRLMVPAMPSTVSVIGSVFNQNAFIHRQGQRLSDYLARAGGPTKDADTGSIYLIKADGSVTSSRQSNWLMSGFESDQLMPGDTVVVPENLDRFRLTKELKDWTQIFFQFALGVTSLKVLKDL